MTVGPFEGRGSGCPGVWGLYQGKKNRKRKTGKKKGMKEMKAAAKSTQNVWDLFAKDDNKICTRRKLRRRGLGLGGDSMIRRMAKGTRCDGS